MPENRRTRSRTILDSRRLMLSAPCAGKTGRDGKRIWASLSVSVFANAPSITVFTNDPDDIDDGRISAAISPVEFDAALIDLERLIAGPEDEEVRRELCNLDRKPARGEKPTVLSSFCYGRKKDGVVWVALSATGRPYIEFPFGYSRYHYLQHGTGEQFSKAEASQLFAKAWVRLMRSFVTDLMRTEYEHPQPPAQNEGAEKNNRGRNSTSAKSHYAEIEDDDIPY